MRELVAMAEARNQERWNHTAALLALTANCHRDPKRRQPYVPADFLPKRADQAPAVPITDLSILKTVFIDRHLPEMSR
ncbi:MAG: hypothetical protein HY859_09090 [Caulobacterales bacterium]|nr:hypothetical protein [Caulobacterales bacterium]